jgi:EAL domain-containing protein (putative c-di-GMP-specific phosphodiesterase class I)
MPVPRGVTAATPAQARAWQEQGLDLTVSVNLSAVTLHNLHFPATVASALARWQVEPRRLIFELTENAIILEDKRASEVVHQIHRMGASVSIDDFGIGYTSLAYLRRLPIGEIKIDKSFILHMRKNPDDAVIVRTIIELGQSLGLHVVAEGVEDNDTFDLLCAYNCELAQGFHMGRPCTIDGLKRWLAASPFSGVEHFFAPDPVRTSG